MYIFYGLEKSNLFIINLFVEVLYYDSHAARWSTMYSVHVGVPDGQQPLHAAPNESTHPLFVQVQVLVSLAMVMVHPSELTS